MWLVLFWFLTLSFVKICHLNKVKMHLYPVTPLMNSTRSLTHLVLTICAYYEWQTLLPEERGKEHILHAYMIVKLRQEKQKRLSVIMWSTRIGGGEQTRHPFSEYEKTFRDKIGTQIVHELRGLGETLPSKVTQKSSVFRWYPSIFSQEISSSLVTLVCFPNQNLVYSYPRYSGNRRWMPYEYFGCLCAENNFK